MYSAAEPPASSDARPDADEGEDQGDDRQPDLGSVRLQHPFRERHRGQHHQVLATRACRRLAAGSAPSPRGGCPQTSPSTVVSAPFYAIASSRTVTGISPPPTRSIAFRMLALFVLPQRDDRDELGQQRVQKPEQADRPDGDRDADPGRRVVAPGQPVVRRRRDDDR